MADNEVQTPTDPAVKISRERSVRYPAYNLEECVEYLKMVHAIGGRKEAPIESILSKLKISSPDNRRYKYLTSSAEVFGLIKKTKNGITPTEFGTSIVYPLGGEEQRKQLLLDAFNAPLIYQKIIERYKDTILPDVQALKPVFYNYGIATNALDTAVNAFIASAQFVGALDQNNRLLSSTPEEGATPIKQHLPEDGQGVQEQKGPAQPPPSKTNITQGDSAKQESDIFRFEIPTTSGKTASIFLPKEWEKEDVELLIKLLRALCPEA